jgi:hypothetical protein
LTNAALLVRGFFPNWDFSWVFSFNREAIIVSE